MKLVGKQDLQIQKLAHRGHRNGPVIVRAAIWEAKKKIFYSHSLGVPERRPIRKQIKKRNRRDDKKYMEIDQNKPSKVYSLSLDAIKAYCKRLFNLCSSAQPALITNFICFIIRKLQINFSQIFYVQSKLVESPAYFSRDRSGIDKLMKSENKQGQLGLLVEVNSKNKGHVRVGPIHIGWVNQLKLLRVEAYKPQKTVQDYLDAQYPIDDPDSQTQRHRYHPQAKTIFDVMGEAGCNVQFLSSQQMEKKEQSSDHQLTQKYEEIATRNKQKFTKQYGIGPVSDCVTIHYEDVGAEITHILIFRDDKYWYRLDTDKRWPGYEY